MYIKDNNGVAEIYTPRQLKRDYPDVSFPSSFPDEVLARFDIYPVIIADKPIYDPYTHKIEEGDIIKVGADWVKQWVVVELDAGERAAESDRQDEVAIKANGPVKTLILMRPNQIDNYINENVTDLDSAKTVLKILAKAISAIGKQSFR